MRPRPAALAAAALALLLAACGGGESGDGAGASTDIPAPGAGSGDQVVIKTFIFRPSPVEIDAGTTLTWTNQDEILHTVTSGERGKADAGQRFDGELDDVGSTFTFTFDRPGTYLYFCKIHPGMDARVVVR